MVVAGEAQQNNEHCHARSSRALWRNATAFARPVAGPSPMATGAAFHGYSSSSKVTMAAIYESYHVNQPITNRTILVPSVMGPRDSGHRPQTHAQCAQATQRGVQGSRVQQRPAYVAAKTTHVTKQHQIPKNKRVYFIWERWLANAFPLVSENRTNLQYVRFRTRILEQLFSRSVVEVQREREQKRERRQESNRPPKSEIA